MLDRPKFSFEKPSTPAPADGPDQELQLIPDHGIGPALPEPYAEQRFGVSMPGVSLVRRYPSVIEQVGIPTGGRFRYYWGAVGIALLAGLYCLFQISGSLAAIRAAETSRSDSIQTLAMIIKDEDQRLADAKDELKDLTRSPANMVNSRTSVLVPAAEQRDSQELRERLAKLEQLFLTRSKVADVKVRALIGDRSPLAQPATPVENSPKPAMPDEYNFDGSIAPVPGVVVHRRPSGEADYWLIQKPGSTADRVRVIPFASTQLGAAVHDMDDGHDYIITLLGEWMKYGV